MFSFHPGGNSPSQVNHQPGDKFLVKNDTLGYSQMIDPTLITIVTSRPKSKIMIYYKDQQIEFSQSLGGLLKIANNPKLARISDSVIVNYDYIDGKQNSSLFVQIWGEIKEVSISKTYAKNVDDWWRYFRSK